MFRTKKQFGQHFLVNQATLQAIADYCSIGPEDCCVEIGPGKGALTRYLIQSQANITAVEIDTRLKPTLERFKQQHQNFSFLMGDVLEVDLASLAKGKVTVAGNLPYEISTPLLFKLVHIRHQINRMVFLLQKEVVDRIVASPGTKAFGRLSVMMQYYFEVEGLLVVPPHDFNPPPKVMSQVVRLVPKVREDWVSYESFSQFVKYLFAMQRKMLRQRFKGMVTPEGWTSLNILPTNRPQDLDLDQILVLYRYLLDNGDIGKLT
ncbi:MAG: 16S rRNA (adenine(1518)-N(6)/adenine(1519)-N(6))-dimethyltransferase RsmA [Pseudomonadota bacterium]|nr:16S rRNA (adenine(1518)-N(6)/adenine(1519)-N(6))-dimethyltransferase RsmA [Pseudomonadota bacterium]